MKTITRLFLALCYVGRLAAANALHLGFMEGAADSVIEIPVYHSGAAAVAGASFDFHFDPARMEFLAALSGAETAAWTLDSEATVANEVRLLLTHPTGGQLPVGEVARVKVRLLETFPHSEGTGAALLRREAADPAAQLGSCLWLPWLEVTAPAAGASLPNNSATAVDFRLSPGERPLATLVLRVNGQSVLSAPNPADRSFLWLPNLTAGGLLDLTVAVTDDENHPVSSAAVGVFINTPPVLAAIGDQTVDELTPLTFTAVATDADLPANTMSYSLIGAPTGAGINPITGAFSWTPTEAQGPGSFTFTVRASDGALNSDQPLTVTVREVNLAPALATIGNKTGDELTPLAFTAVATDGDLPANTLTYSLINAPAGAAINPITGAFAWTPSEGQGPNSFTFTVRASDGALNDDQNLTVTVREVNVAPVLAAIGNQAVDELAPLTFTAVATDADLPANTLTYSLINAPAGAIINPGTGAFAWTPTEAQGPGSFTITVRASDGALNSDQTLTVTVRELNVAPVLAAIGNQTVDELTPLTFTAVATDADRPANTINYSLIGEPAGAAINPSTGVFTWTPTEAQGPNSFIFTVRASDGALNSDQMLTVTVREVNVAPVLAVIGNKAVDELTPLTFTAVATDADLPANTITYSLVNAPAGATINSSNGAFAWTPTEAQGPGSFTFTVRASDGALNSDQTLTVTVREVNLAPVLATIGNKTVDELTPLTFTAVATDADLPANTVRYSLIGAPTGAGINTSTGAFSWTPAEAQGPGSFTFTVRASDGALYSDQALTVTVREVNVAPLLALAALGNKVIDEHTTLTFTAVATDADLPANTITYSLLGAPAGAGIHPVSGVFSWTPSEAQGPGSFTFTVRAGDGIAVSEQAVTVTVREINVAPVLTAIPYQWIDQFSSLAFTAIASDGDLPANTLTYSLINAPAGAGINPHTGDFTWTPGADQGPGLYWFTVRVSDGDLTDESLVIVTVLDVTPPVLVLPSNITAAATGAGGAVVDFTVSAIDGADGTVAATTVPPGGSTFALGTTTVLVAATDAAGNTAHGSFTVTVVDLAGLVRNGVITQAGPATLAGISGEIRDGPPGGSLVMQASADLGEADPWEDIGTIPLDASGHAVFGPITDPHSTGLPRDFFRVKLP